MQDGGIGVSWSGLVCGAVVALTVSAGLSCAEGKLSGEGDTEDAADDLASEGARDLDLAPDPDLTADPDLDDPDPDMDVPELIGECVPFSVTCTEDGYAIQRCSAEGALFEPFGCTLEQICEDGEDGVQCVACELDVNCREEVPTCEPNQSFCLDFQTAASCTAEGQVGTTFGCGNGRCFGGGCNNSGNETGEVCTNNAGCRGRFCLCGDEDSANEGSAVCAGNLASGYCSTSSCDVNGCHPDDEVCADFELSGAFGGGRLCVLRENCGTRMGACRVGHRGDGHVCRELPSTDGNGARSWALGCWAPPAADLDNACAGANCIAPIGGACSDEDDCIGGLCLSTNGVSYCSAPCDESRRCPSYAACVRPNAGSDNHFCAAKAQELDCPRLLTNFNIVSRSFAELGGVRTAQVCWAREE